MASRMAARSTTAGTPVKSCRSTRAGVKAISRSGSAFGSQWARASMSSADATGRLRCAAGFPAGSSAKTAIAAASGNDLLNGRELPDRIRLAGDGQGRTAAKAIRHVHLSFRRCERSTIVIVEAEGASGNAECGSIIQGAWSRHRPNASQDIPPLVCGGNDAASSRCRAGIRDRRRRAGSCFRFPVWP